MKNEPKHGGIIRNKFTRDFAMLPNALCRNKALTWEARGMLCYLLSQAEDWETRLHDLIAQSPAGRDQTKRIIRELEAAGYMVRERIHNEKTGRFEWVTSVYATPQMSPSTENPAMDKPATANPATGKPSPEKAAIYKGKAKQTNEKKQTAASNGAAPAFDESTVAALRAFGITKPSALDLATRFPDHARRAAQHWAEVAATGRSVRAGLVIASISNAEAYPDVHEGGAPVPLNPNRPIKSEAAHQHELACAQLAATWLTPGDIKLHGKPPGREDEFVKFMWRHFDRLCKRAEKELARTP